MKRIALLIPLFASNLLIPATVASAAVIGMNEAASALTPSRVSSLPDTQRAAWQEYLARSEAQLSRDKASLAAELAPGQPLPPPPAEGKGADTMPLDKPAAWYTSKAARHVADVIVSFQTPAGGWGKNQPRDGALRLPGQHYTGENVAKVKSGSNDLDAARDRDWHYVGTIDNDATVTEIRFLAQVVSQLAPEEAVPYRDAALKGIEYLLASQFPNGGWPQVWPLEGGYHDAITYNDDALVHVAELLRDIAAGTDGFGFVPPAIRTRALEATNAAIHCIVETQVVQDGKRLGWGQQHDALTLRPTSARNFEPAALSSTESARILLFLMEIEAPSDAVKQAIRGGVAWLNTSVIRDRAWVKSDQGYQLVTEQGAKPLWSRFYSLEGNKPVFGDRDKTIHDDVMGISQERRTGYAWYTTSPQKALSAFTKWEKRS